MIKELNLKIGGAELNLVTDNTTDINMLIGKSFKRNKYGLSIWTDKISFVGCRFKIVDRTTKTVDFYIIGETTRTNYSLDEIVLVHETPEWNDEGYKKLMLNEAFQKSGLKAVLKKSTNNNI